MSEKAPPVCTAADYYSRELDVACKLVVESLSSFNPAVCSHSNGMIICTSIKDKANPVCKYLPSMFFH